MRKHANTALIGFFILTAILLIVSSVVVFVGNKLLIEKKTYVVYFDGSIKGLNIGTPVKFRGVKVGEVKDIQVKYFTEKSKVYIPIYIDIYQGVVHEIEGKDKISDSESFKRLIDAGLKAQLQLESLLTGKLFINLDFYPREKVSLKGISKKLPEIPTVPSTVDALTKKIERLPLEELAQAAFILIEDFDRFITSPEFVGVVKSLSSATKQAENLLHNIDKEVIPLSKEMRVATKAAITALERASSTFAEIETIVHEDSSLNNELGEALNEVSKAATSIRKLVDYLEKDPNAIVFGKQE